MLKAPSIDYLEHIERTAFRSFEIFNLTLALLQHLHYFQSDCRRLSNSSQQHQATVKSTPHCEYTSFEYIITLTMLRSNNKRSQLLGLSKRKATLNTKSPTSSDRKPMTPSSSSARREVRLPSQSTRIGHSAKETFSEKEIIELKESFLLFDVEGKGIIEVGAFRSVLESLLLDSNGQSYPHLEEILRLLEGRSDDETLDFDDYLSLMAGTTLHQRLQGDSSNDQPNFQYVFDLFDGDGKGFITVEDLRRVAIELGEHDMTMDELQEMFDRSRSRKTGKVTLKEFSKMMTINLFHKAVTDGNYNEAPAQEN